MSAGQASVCAIIDNEAARWWNTKRPLTSPKRVSESEGFMEPTCGKICSVPGCDRKIDSRGYCGPHANRWRRHGDPLGGKVKYHGAACRHPDGCPRPPYGDGWCSAHFQRIKRTGNPGGASIGRVFASYDLPSLLARGVRDEVTGCLRWQTGKNREGYASTTFNGRTISIHRLVYSLAVGEIPPGYEVDHVRASGCRFRDCFEPSHLEAVTPAENSRRIPRVPPTHCLRGHEYTEENTRVQLGPTGLAQRKCRACARLLRNGRAAS